MMLSDDCLSDVCLSRTSALSREQRGLGRQTDVRQKHRLVLRLLGRGHNKKVSYRKQIARQHSWSTLQNFSSHLLCPACKIWLLFLITTWAHVGGPKFRGRWRAALFGYRCGWPIWRHS